MNLYTIVLSAGKGTRMQSSSPKVLKEILGESMIEIILEELNKVKVDKNHLIIGYKKEDVKKHVSSLFSNVDYAVQEEQLGTGHAVQQLKDKMENLEGITLITCGDTPLVTEMTFKNLLEHHKNNENDLTILSTELSNPFGYGRIVKDDTENVLKIVEQKDATEKEQQITEINSGIYCIDNKKLFECIDLIDNKNEQKEYYLTDIVSIFINKKYKVGTYISNESSELIGVNSLVDLAKAEELLKRRINLKHLENGVQIMDINNTYIGPKVKIQKGTIIYPNNYIVGDSSIGKNNILKPSNYIANSIIGHDNEIGPMCHIRNNSEIKGKSRVGNFVEVKNSVLNEGVKSAHLTYLGDTEIGESTNIGCGVITANYDGVNKYKTKIGSNVFVGSNVNLIAPINIDNHTFIAAGTTVAQDVGSDKFVIGRVREQIKDKKKG